MHTNGALFFLDYNGKILYDFNRFKTIVTEYPMGANKLLDDAEKTLDENYQRAKAAFRVLRQTRMLEGSTDSVSPQLVPLHAKSSEADVEAALDGIVNQSGHGYYRLSDLITKLYEQGVGHIESPLKFKRRVRVVLKNMARKRAIRLKVNKGRGGTIYMPKDSEQK